MPGLFFRKYATTLDATTAGSIKVRLSIRKAGSADFAAGGDWTPATGDVKVSIDGGAQANVGTLPAYSNGAWEFVLSGSELTGKSVNVNVVDSATKAVDDDSFLVETYGNASAMYPTNFVDAVRMGLTALPNANAEAAGGLYTRGSGAGQINQAANGQIDSRLAAYASGFDDATARGTIQSATASTAVLDANAPATDSVPQFCWLVILAGTGFGQARIVSAYTGSTKTATVVPNWTTTPDNTSKYAIVGVGEANVGYVRESQINSLISGRIDSNMQAALATLVLLADVRKVLNVGVTADGNGLLNVNTADYGGTAVTALPNSGNVTVGGYAAGQDTALRRGTAQTGSAGTIRLDGGASATDNFYQWSLVEILAGAGAGQCRLINAYSGSTKDATVIPNWVTAPDLTSVFAVFPWGEAIVGYWRESLVNALIGGRVDGNVQAASATINIAANVKQIGGTNVVTDANNLLSVNAADWGGVAVGGMPNSGNVTVGGYAAGQDPLTLVTGGNKTIAVDASNRVALSVADETLLSNIAAAGSGSGTNWQWSTRALANAPAGGGGGGSTINEDNDVTEETTIVS